MDSQAYSHAILMRCFATSHNTLSPITKQDISEDRFPECKHLSNAVVEVDNIGTRIANVFTSEGLLGEEIYTREQIQLTLATSVAKCIESEVLAPLRKILNDPFSGTVLEGECYLCLSYGFTVNKSSLDRIHAPNGVVEYDGRNNATLHGAIIGRRHRRLEGCGDIQGALIPLREIINDDMASDEFAAIMG